MPNKSGNYYVKQAEKNGLRVGDCHGSHVKIYGPADRGFMIVPQHNSLSPGVEHSVIKWFAKLGIIVGALVACGLISQLFCP